MRLRTVARRAKVLAPEGKIFEQNLTTVFACCERYIGRCRKHWDEHFEAAAVKKRARANDFVYDTPHKLPTLQRRPSAVEVASCERLVADTKMIGAD